jgi:hypothetical protein
MNYPWLSNFLIEAADSKDDGTNEPFDPNEDTEKDNTSNEVTDDTVDDTANDTEENTDDNIEHLDDTSEDEIDDNSNIVQKKPQEPKSSAEIDELKQQISELKEQLDELQKSSDVEEEVNKLKQRLDNLDIPDEANLNDSLFQISKKDIQIIKRAIRRCFAKASSLNSKQQEKIINEVRQNSHLSYQEISKKLSGVLGARQLDIFDFLMNTDYGFRHRHRRYI